MLLTNIPMKIIFYLVTVTVLIACENETKDYVTFYGKITNYNSDSLLIFNSDGFRKKVSLEEDGSFYDTLNVVSGGIYSYFDGTEMSSVYLKNGFNVKLTLDAKYFDETIKYEGVGAEPNNYLAKTSLLREGIMSDSLLFTLDEDNFDSKVEVFAKEMSDLLSESENYDAGFVREEAGKMESFKEALKASYKKSQFLLSLVGQDSPKFVDYENYDGGNTSLDDFKGKYVYIDLWATWCGPCKYEIPYLKEIEKTYHSENIVFVSISMDKAGNYQKWRDMVRDRHLSGVQLYAKEDESFADAYGVEGIPRFILVSPEGMVVDANAPRPSSPKLRVLLDGLI